jgi:hypothetical protein
LILFNFITRLWSWWNLLLFARQFRKRLTISVLLQDCDCRRISFFLFFSRFREKSSFSVCFLWFRNYQKKIMNRSLNIERARSMTAVSQIRSDSSMSNRYEDFFQKSKKSSKAQEISKLNLIISELKKLKTRSSIKNSSFTRLYKEKEKVAQNHSAENENREIAEMTRTNFNVQKYIKTKYNRNAVIFLFIFSDRNLNLMIFQEIIDVDMRTTKFLYDIMFSTKKADYRKKTKSFLNSFNDCFLEKFVSYFQTFLKKFRRDSSTQEDDLQLNLKRLSKSSFQKNYSIKSLLQFFIKERSISAFHNWNEKILNRTNNRYRDEDFKYSKLEHLRSKFNDYFFQKKDESRQSRLMYNQDRSRIDDYYSKEYSKIDEFQFSDYRKNFHRKNQHEKYQTSFRQNRFMNRYSKNSRFAVNFHMQNQIHRQIVDFDLDSAYVFRQNRKLLSINNESSHDYFERNSRFFSQNSRNQVRIKLRFTNIMLFNSEKHSIAFFIRRFQHIAELEELDSVLRVLSMCFFESVLEWHNFLSRVIRQEMNQNLNIWKNEFLREFRSNKFASLKKAKKLIFRFDESLTISQYFSRKTNFLHDVEIRDENTMIEYFWKNLKSNLILTTFMRENEDTLKSFERKIRMNEIAMKRLHDLFNKTRIREFDVQKSRKSRFNDQKLRYQNNKKSSISAEKIERLIKKLFIVINATLKSKSSNSKDDKITKILKRFCRHCQDSHWDNECSNKTKNEKKILFLKKNENDHDFISSFNENDLQILKNVFFDHESKNWVTLRRSTMTTWKYFYKTSSKSQKNIY